MAQLLLEHGADPNALQNPQTHVTPLMIAAGNHDEPLIRLLLNHGASLDVSDLFSSNCSGPIHWTNNQRTSSHAQASRLVALPGNDPGILNMRDDLGRTPLVAAPFQNWDLSFIQALLEQGADPNGLNGDHTAPLEIAVERAMTMPSAALFFVAVAHLLLDAGATADSSEGPLSGIIESKLPFWKNNQWDTEGPLKLWRRLRAIELDQNLPMNSRSSFRLRL